MKKNYLQKIVDSKPEPVIPIEDADISNIIIAIPEVPTTTGMCVVIHEIDEEKGITSISMVSTNGKILNTYYNISIMDYIRKCHESYTFYSVFS